MAKRKVPKSKRRSVPDVLISLFDADNLETIDQLRRKIVSAFSPDRVPDAWPERGKMLPAAPPASIAERIVAECSIAERERKAWQPGNIDIEIIHRGWVRISKDDWPALIDYGKRDRNDGNISKQFRLHVLDHCSGIKLVYGIYRYKNNVAGAWVDARCGKLVDTDRRLREAMVNLAHWLTAQPHAGRNYDVWEELIDEAMSKLGATQTK